MTTSADIEKQVSSKEPIVIEETPVSKKRSIPFASIILLVIVLAAVAYGIFTTIQLRHQTERKEQGLLSQIAELNQQQKNAFSLIGATEKKLKHSRVQLQSQLTDMNKQLQSAMQQRMYQTNDWLLLKARYYLELAQINSHWSSNTQTTAALLQQADELLTHNPDQQLFAVRQVIAKEIAQVQAVPKIDITGILSQLDAAQNAILNLPIKQTINNAENQTTNAVNADASSWRGRLQNSMRLLEKLVVIKRHDGDFQPLFNPSSEALLRERIRLNLQETQWAVLQNDEELYQWLLTQTIKQISQSFQQDDASTQALLKQLQTLQEKHLVQQNPVLNQSLPLLNQVIDAKNNTKPDSANNPGETHND